MVLNIVKDILNLVPVAAIDNEEREEFVNGSKYNTLAINRKNPIFTMSMLTVVFKPIIKI